MPEQCREVFSSLGPERYPPGHIVSRGPEQVLLWRDLLAAVASLQARLADQASRNWALFEPDTYDFAVALLALLGLGHRVYIPGDCHPATVRALQQQGCSLIGNFAGLENFTIHAGEESPTREPQIQPLGELVVFTSGSSGQPKAIAKAGRQIDAELAALEQQWGMQLQQNLIAGTVSHQHFYGLLFSVLWPLCQGRSFWRSPFVDPTPLLKQLAPLAPFAWIASPAHLHRLGDALPLLATEQAPQLIFSSGGPLQTDAALQIAETRGEAPIEVLGSSETGGIAWRQQCDSDTPWQPLPGVRTRIGADGALAIRSPMLARDAWHHSADSAKPAGGSGFTLGARLDRIAKIEGKRVSLPAVEQALLALDWIEEAAALPLPGQRIGAVIVLSEAGHAGLAVQLLPGLLRQLRRDLAARLPAAAVPRRFRLVARLPRNPQGKLPLSDLRALFQPALLPPLLRCQRDQDTLKLQLLVRSDSPWFNGHFPSAPVLPGVVLLKWVEDYARRELGLQGEFLGMKGVKFQQLVRPNTLVTFHLDYNSMSGWLTFAARSSDGDHARGKLRFGACD
ncbi:AMP-binding protein [Parahaliea aestuarii]|uniref:Long-chain-fatty-acid--CoA ligase n=1 Tax=Parahaliea aestuarii TaxID=1852021 RepID=A0A5C8ZSK6_9GAMM|nr:AMP-binding protein [Parahaliea aestuarii]TXS90447.1 AMP-binding protein [Parahaliea aestuarii]